MIEYDYTIQFANSGHKIEMKHCTNRMNMQEMCSKPFSCIDFDNLKMRVLINMQRVESIEEVWYEKEEVAPHTESWLPRKKAQTKLNEMNLGFTWFGNLFQYLREKGTLDGLCKKEGKIWLYDTEGIVAKIKAGEFDYHQR